MPPIASATFFSRFRRAAAFAPVIQLHDDYVRQHADEKQNKKEGDQPGER